MTARFNGYYHAKLRVNETLKKINENENANFNTILPVIPSALTQSSAESSGDLDEAIKKSSIAIQIHPKSKWVDDNYLIVGMANLLKEDYSEAEKSFQYIIATYRDVYPQGALSKKQLKKRAQRKKEGKKGIPFLTHTPARQDAFLWLAQTYINQGKASEALSILNNLKSDEEFNAKDENVRQYELLSAALAVQKKEYATAIESLDNAATLTKKKKERRRIAFILGQLHQEEKNFDLAIRQYETVLKLKPDYKMAFHAELFKIQSAREAGILSEDEMELALEELLRDEKNEEFSGSIYYIKALLALNHNDIDGAKEYFKESLKYSSDKVQKTEAYLKLAEILYDEQQYIYSYAYYDSTLSALNKNHPSFEEAGNRRDVLKDLTKELKYIQIQDSIANWNQLSPEERLKRLEEQRALKEKAASEKQKVLKDENAEWELYNPTLRKKGFEDFKAVWGKRRLTDNWRRSVKIEEEEEEVVEDPDEKIDPDKINTPTVSANDKKMIEAIYSAGNILLQRIENYPGAIAQFERLNAEFPDNPYRLETLFKLYDLYKKTNKHSLAAKTKATLVADYPDSKFAAQLSNPNYAREQAALNQQISKTYETCFNAYNSGDYKTAANKIQAAMQKYPDADLFPRFALLKALVVGKTNGVEDFKLALSNVFKPYPDHEAGIKAREIFDHLGEQKGNNTIKRKSKFIYRSNEIHYVAILVQDAGSKANKTKVNLSNYNQKYYSLDKLKVQSNLFGLSKSIILVKHFIGEDKASKFMNKLNSTPNDVLAEFSDAEKQVFIISKSKLCSAHAVQRNRQLHQFLRGKLRLGKALF